MRTLKSLPFLLVCLFSLPQIAFAALPPDAQNRGDINIMIAFAQQHDAILDNLKSIHLFNHAEAVNAHDAETSIANMKYPYGMIVYHLNNELCRAYFIRGESTFDGPGPAPDLEFFKSSCQIDY